jgi:TatD DNase family protein
LETDSPYLAPDPYRGKRNEPSFVPLVATKLAEIYDIGVGEIAKTTSNNAKKVFRET